ncbi:MAG: tetratricopeptide repeat protein [Bdellovibrionaceae bacterium]|nr:tetratricopeptide repeat protein [Pseudobdellovibrionaceae bacterium]
MAKISITWIIKNYKGQIKGPYTTIEILNFISDGTFTGEEQITKYPGGEWTTISKEPEFYEKILETLENQLKDSENKSGSQSKPPSNTRTTPQSRLDRTAVMPSELRSVIKPAMIPPVSSNKSIGKSTSEDSREFLNQNKTEIIELNNIDQEKTKEKLNTLRWPVFAVLLIGALTLVYFGLFDDDAGDAGDKVSLIAPGPSQDGLKASEIDARVNRALQLISADTPEYYIEAQNILVATIENSIKNIKPRMILCAVYKELWPYSRQNLSDQKAISQVAKQTKSMNKIDTAGMLCESVKLLVEGRYSEAHSVVDKALEKDYTNFFLYQIKGEILEHDNQKLIAESFYQKARELSGQWVKPIFYQALINAKLNEPNKAFQLFGDALKINRNHKNALFGMGILESSRGQQDKAIAYITNALSIEGKAEKGIESQGIETLVEIYLIKGDKKKAIELANLNLAKNPSKKSATHLCERLGGCDKSIAKNARPDEELFFSCQALFRQKEYLQAQAECKSAFELNTKNGTAALTAGEALWYLGQSVEAVLWIEKAIKADPRNVKAYLKKAEFLSDRFDFIEAEKVLLQADYISGKSNFEVQRGFASLAFKKRDFQSTLKLAERALKSYDADMESIVLYSSAARNLAIGFRVNSQKDQEQRQKLAQDAYNYALKAIELDSTNIQAQINYAKVIATRQGIDVGGDYLIEMIKLYPSLYEYRIALAEIYIEEERYKQAIEELQRVLSMNSKNKKALMAIAKSYFNIGETDNAITNYLKASNQDPSDAEPIFEVAKIYLEKGKVNQAQVQFERVLVLNKKYPKANFFIGRVMILKGNYSEAEKYAEIEKKMYPQLIDPYLLIAELKYINKNYTECAAEYARATNFGNQPAAVYVKAARCYRLSGQLDMAQGFVDIASEKESGYEEIYKEQGALFESRGDAVSAIRSYCKYSELSPNSKDREEIQSQIQVLGGECGH